MNATSAARAYARDIAGDPVRMIQASETSLTTTATEPAGAALRPTIYRPSRPSITRVENGEEIETEIFRGPALARAGIDFREPVQPGSEVVAIRVPALDVDDLVEIRIPRIYAEAARDATLDRQSWHAPRRLANTLMLPHGWLLIEGSVATVVSQTGDGRTRIEFDAPVDSAPEIVLKVQRC
jgi:hypothetical protein